MNINSLSSPSATSSVGGLSSVGSQRAARTSSVPPPPAGASASISKPGELLSKLQQLQQSDPAKFKEVTAELSKQLKDAAGSATGPAAAALNKLADGLAQASSTGSLDALTPKGGAKGHHSHHHHGGGGGGGAVGAALSSALETVQKALDGSTTSATSPTTSATATSATSAG